MTETVLTGSAYDRGRQQAACGRAAKPLAVAWIGARLTLAKRSLRTARVRHFLAGLWDFADAHHPHVIAETRGMAAGFGFTADDMFASLHAAVLGEVAAQPRLDLAEGCTAIALGGGRAPLLAKNRDVGADVLPLQRVFRIEDPAHRHGPILGVSSLGSSPCASSGINAAGLCIADTHVATTDHGIGLSRYFLMEDLLGQCASVDDALSAIAAVRHLGGGTLMMADAAGAIAWVELGHRHVARQRAAKGWLLRTNHFIDPVLRRRNGEAAGSEGGRNSRGRFARARHVLTDTKADAAAVRALLSGHGKPGPAFCRHGGTGNAHTISLALFSPKERGLSFCNGPPCSTPATHHRIAT